MKKSMKLLTLLAICLALTVFGMQAQAQAVQAAPNKLYTKAKASSLMDVTSGRLLHSQNGDEQLRIASLTKIMTAIVAIENGGDLDAVVTTSRRAAGREGSSIYLQLGEEMSLRNLLYGLMLRSGNDAATAISEYVGGSEEGFVHMMNEKAELIGLPNTQFRNPHGLDADGHYSSANDLAKLTAYAMHNETFASIVAEKEMKVPNPYEKWHYRWVNKNKMLNMYEGADGVKTGYTKKALRCLVSSATRDGQQLVAVTINDGDDWRDHKQMLDYGFKHYQLHTLAEKGQPIGDSDMIAAETFRYALLPGEISEVRSKLLLEHPESLAYRFGSRGLLEWHLGGERIGAVPVTE